MTCGGGNRTRTRKCSNPAPKWNGKDCPGANTYTESCNLPKCEGRCLFLKVFIFSKMIPACFDTLARIFLALVSEFS